MTVKRFKPVAAAAISLSENGDYVRYEDYVARVAEVRAQARNELIDELESRFNEMTKALPAELQGGAAGAAAFVSTLREGIVS
ncbi:hypothetical protein NCW85_000641 [Salmonella enterica]|nr:hypothetical protein [Salmonella enterica]EDD3978363.1 hypothetical protein [Salmonella enterica subsp. enterica serovar Poona]EDI2722188.1 hypothetical protein [Salmonella enterica subsp. enterica serovar Rubislaw]EAS1383064.1 hypothetical protein [Salmonella enterica]EAW8901039.1 hypothetical protein [Salmonella enterica]